MTFEEDFPSFLKEVKKLTRMANKSQDIVDFIIIDRKAMLNTCLDKQKVKDAINRMVCDNLDKGDLLKELNLEGLI